MSSPTPWTWAFDQSLPAASGDAKTLLGGKGASLAGMTQAGFEVPPGFTISTAACRWVMEHDGAWPAGLAEEIQGRLQDLEQRSGRRFGDSRQPLLVSVRSGAAQSMPGMMDTLLNVGLQPSMAAGPEDHRFWTVYGQFVAAFLRSAGGLEAEWEDGQQPPYQQCQALLQRWRDHSGEAFPSDHLASIVACVNAVFRSWKSPRAKTYRQRHGLDDHAGTAVNVQVMWPSESSGVVFTRDPNDPHSSHLVIEAARGLGEAVVSGDVTPDRYLVQRDDPERGEYFSGEAGREVAAMGESQEAASEDGLVLSRPRIAELSRLCLRVEEWFGAPMDIEWGLADGRLALLQCRPIRGMDILLAMEPARLAMIEELRMSAVRNDKPVRKLWVTHNLGETLQSPTPLTWDVVSEFMSGSGGFGRMYQDFGYRPHQSVQEKGFLRLIAGHIYADIDQQAGLFWGDLPLIYDADKVVNDHTVLEGPPGKLDPERADVNFLLNLPGTIAAMWRCSRRMRRIGPSSAETFEQSVLPQWLAYVKAEGQRDLDALAPSELTQLLDDRIERVLNDFGKESLKPGFFGGLALSQLQGLIAQFTDQDEAAIVARTLTSGLDGDITWEQDHSLAQVAEGSLPLADFLARFGHRASGEMELARPRWGEDPSALDGMLDQARRAGLASLSERHRATAQRREDMEAQLPERLRAWGGSSYYERIMQQLQLARTLLPYREKGKYYLMMGYALIRDIILALGRRWDFGPDIFLLTRKELQRLASGDSSPRSFDSLIEERRLQHVTLQRLELPPVIDSHNLDQLGLPDESEGGEERSGIAVSAGIASGPAVLVFDPREAHDLGSDYVLVCPSTDPGWTPLFIGAKALVVERGGTLSHGAIVARDFGIPAVTLAQATKWLRPGDSVRVDGNRGIVTRIAQGDES